MYDLTCLSVTCGRSVVFSEFLSVSSTNKADSHDKTDSHDITEILLKVALSTIAITLTHSLQPFCVE